MASFFGEVVFPVSRAFWDEEDENEFEGQPIYQPEFFIQWLKEKPTKINTLIVVEGEMLIDFSKECLCQNTKEICFIEDDKQKKVSTIYQVKDDVYLWIIFASFNVKFSGKLVDTMIDVLSTVENTVCITCRHITQYKNKNVPNVPSFLRMLNTRSGGGVCKLQIPLLEQPNIVYGVAAGVLSYAEIMDLPAILYVLYTDTFVLDSSSAEPLIKLFASMNCTLHDVSFAGKDFFNKGNLYM